MIYLIFGLVILLCYWALWQPERAFGRGWRRRALWLVVAGYGLLVALAATGPQPFYSLLFIVYPLLYGVLLRRPVRALLRRVVAKPVGRFVVVFGLLWFSELFAALDIADRDPVGRHMIVYIGFYVGLALVIVWAYNHWRYSFAALFTIGGLWGVLVERQFAGTMMLASGNIPTFLVFASLIFGVYGFFLAGPYLLFYEEFSANPRRSRWQQVALFIAVAVIPLVTWALWSLLLAALGFDTTVLVV